MNDLKKSEMECLKALNDMCDVLQKAIPGMPGRVSVRPQTPDHTDEQVFQARGSVAPLEGQGHGGPVPEAPETEMPQIDEGVANDLSSYTPEKLHSIVQLASKHIADALMQGIMKHRQSGGGSTSSANPANRDNPMQVTKDWKTANR